MNQLDSFFRPRSVAVVGASHDPAKLGHVLLKNVLDYGFQGEVFPVNPAGGTILGRRAYPSLRDVPAKPDLVLLSVPNRAVPPAVRDAAARGARGAVILASGFGEMGGDGTRLQKAVGRAGLRVVGPNCMGVYHLPGRLNATYFWDLPRREGNVAFISQSGAYGGMLFGELRRRAMGLSTFLSIGNQADVTHADALEHLARDRTCEVVGLFIEGIRDGRRFFEACRALARRKAVVAMKVGRTAAGRRAALSHTGSMTGDFEVCRAALVQAGAYVARDTDEFFDALAAFSAHPRGLPAGGLGIVTISGGPSVAAADACEEARVAVPELSEATQARVRALVPEFGATRNPVDMTPQMDPSRMGACVKAVAEDPQVRALLAINVGLDRSPFADAFIASGKPVVACVIDAPQIAARLADANIPIFPTPERAVRAISALVRGPAAVSPAPAPAEPRQALDEHASKRLLARAGIPVCREEAAASIEAVRRAAARLGYPVVLKALGAGPHKSDRGGVHVGLAGEPQLAAAYRDLVRRFGPRVLVQEQLAGDHEVLLGARRDPTFGPVVLFGSGGIWTEHVRDISLRVGPITPAVAREMIAETRAGERLRGLRGTAAGDVDALSRMLVALSRFLERTPRVVEIDLNPVITGGSRTAAVDALIVTK